MSAITLPHNLRFEQLLLGCVLSTVNAANYLMPLLSLEDFYGLQHRAIFAALKELFERDSPLDLNTIVEQAKTCNSLKNMGGISYLVEIVQSVGTGIAYEEYLKDLQEFTAKRALINASKNCLEDVLKPESKTENVISNLQKTLYQIQGIQASDTKMPKDILDKFSSEGSFDKHLLWMKARKLQGLPPYVGISSGYKILDETLGFFKDGCIYYIGARTSMGKTTFMLNLIRNMIGTHPEQITDLPIGIFSLEMPAPIILSKMLCLSTGVKYSEFEDGSLRQHDTEKLLKWGESYEKTKLYIEDEEDITISKLRSRARRMRDNYGIKILFIDYLTRIKSDTKYPSKHLQVDEISKGLQSLAKELNIPVICLAQLNRQLTTRTDPTPSLVDFRESGSIEEDCDGAILLHRPDYYNPNDVPGSIYVIVAKNRVRGILKKIHFKKEEASEKYKEEQDLGMVVREITKSQNEPVQDEYVSPYDSIKEGWKREGRTGYDRNR